MNASKTIVVAALLALSFTTGFTCSKNTPETTTTTTTETVAPPAQDQMGTPAPGEGQIPPAGEPAPAYNDPAPAAPTAPTGH